MVSKQKHEEIDIVIINFDNLEDTWIFVKLLEYKSLGAYLVSRFKRPKTMTFKKPNVFKYARTSELKFDQNERIDLNFVNHTRR